MSLLGIDIGTTGTKGVVYSESGVLLAQHYRSYPLYTPDALSCELDTRDVTAAFQEVVAACASTVKTADPVTAIGLSTLGDSVTPLDTDDRPLHRTLIGAADRRAVKQTGAVAELIDRTELFRKTGAPLQSFCAVPKIMWFRDERPDIFSRTAKFAGLQEIAHTVLGVPPRIDRSLASRTMLMDIRTGSWADDLLRLCGIGPELFFPLAGADEVCGAVSRDAAEALGLNPGTRVVAGGFDQCCGAVGSGSVRSGTAALSMGTLEAVVPFLDSLSLHPLLLSGSHGCNFHALPGRYSTLGYVTTSGAALRWFGEKVLQTDDPETAFQTMSGFAADFDGPGGVTAFPYFAGPGTPHPEEPVKAAFIGLALDTGVRDMFQALAEGIAYEAAWNIGDFTDAGIFVGELRAAGGGTRLEALLQLRADVTGLPVIKTSVREAAGLGAAFLAGMGSGVYSSAEDIGDLVKTERVFEPRREV
jgi:xylulokinase